MNGSNYLRELVKFGFIPVLFFLLCTGENITQLFSHYQKQLVKQKTFHC